MKGRISLDQVEWSRFKVSDIFTVENSKPYHKDRLEQHKYGVPYITRTSLNNGLEDTIKESDFKFNKRNSISLGAENADFFYQPYDYIAGNKMYSISHSKVNKNIGLFLVQAFRSSITNCGFGYGKGLTGTRMKDRFVMLPVDSEGNPNWSFMGNYIKQEQNKVAQQVIDYYEQKMLETAFDLLDFESVTWKKFKIGELFNFERKSSKGLAHLEKDPKGISYLGATNRNNGVLEYVKPIEKLIYNGNAIAFIRNGEGSMGYSVYKSEKFMATQDISVGYNSNLDKYSGMFITTFADRVRGKYNFGYKRNQNRLENELIELPVDNQGNPNWEYMSQFVQKLEAEKLQEVLEYIYIYILAILRATLLTPLDEKSWSEFWLEDIVTISSGIRLTKANQEKGNRAFIGSSDSNNGITEFVSNTNNSLDSNVLGVNYNGSVVENFYHPYEAIFSDDVKRIHWIDKDQEDRYTYLFLKQVILQQKVKYAYGYKFNAGRMKRQKIMLPVKEDGAPDYDYMKEYIQIEEIKQSYKILKYYSEFLRR